jgi:NifU-like protein involved in Fe-S cluster formation
MNAPLYTMEILRLAASLEPPAPLRRIDGRAELRSPTCGSRVAVEVEVDANGRIRAVSQTVHACAFGQAAAALVQHGAVERSTSDVAEALASLDSWLSGASERPGEWPGLETLAPARSRKGRHGAIRLPFRALLAALESIR